MTNWEPNCFVNPELIEAKQHLKQADLQIQSLVKASYIKNDVFKKKNEVFSLEEAINEVINLYGQLQIDKRI